VLKNRIVTALVLAIALLAVVVWLPPAATIVLLAAAILAGAWEWSAFLRASSTDLRVGFVTLLAATLAATWFAIDTRADLRSLLLVAAAWWCFALGWLMLAPRRIAPWSVGLAGVLALVPMGVALADLRLKHPRGAEWTLFALALVWAADTGAFFAGRRFGRVRLAPQVSPGKSWEGVCGGMLLALACAWAGAEWFELPVVPFVAVCLGAAAFSVVGDLTESMMKRHAGLKDSGRIFPGHGGVLDRLDSVTAAAPLFVLGLYALEGMP
jgi:phosphatidate cytidylyltransferase